MSDADTLVVVYQFGKVASTALVKSLNACDGIEAHQSHFLGEDALKRMVSNAVAAGVGPYFRTHMVGQLVRNLDLTYQINRILSGKDDRRLVVVSLSREPVDWLRSCIQQDIVGYEDEITRYSQGSLSDGTPIETGLVSILEKLTDFSAENGGMDKVVHEILEGRGAAMIQNTDVLQHEIERRLLHLAVRPLIWFEDHFAKCFDIGIDDLSQNGSHWRSTHGNATFVVLRYEDIKSEFSSAMNAVGVSFDQEISHSNISRDKPFAKDIRDAFGSIAAESLRRDVLQTGYARHFGYQ